MYKEGRKKERKVNKIAILGILVTLLSTAFIGFNSQLTTALPDQQPGPLLDKMVFATIPDPSAALAALLAGQIDVSELTSPADIQAVQQAGLLINRMNAYSLHQMFFNLDHNVTNDARFRRAVAHLVPKEQIIDDYFGGLLQYAYNFLAPSHYWYDANIPDPTTYDPALAASMLDQAGYTKGSDGWRIDWEQGRKCET